MAVRTKLPEIMGLPPWDLEGRTNEILRNSMPVAEIYPSQPSFKQGIDLFSRVSDWDRYLNILANMNYEPADRSAKKIKVAFLADSFPTDQFQNEYGENFLQKFTDVASEGAASIAQFFGGRTGTEALERATKALAGAGGITGAIGGGLEAGREAAGKAINAIFDAAGGRGRRTANFLDRLAAGARIDFPQLWKTSSYSPSYTMTIRLYNPDPTNDQATDRFIVGPIAALLSLAAPISEDGGTYQWPFIHRIRSIGIYDLDPAYISSVSIVKGGDQQNIAYNQRLGVVDVRIDFGSLYNSMVTGVKDIASGRPTVKKYIDVMKEKRVITDRLGETILYGTKEADTRKRAPTFTETPQQAALRVNPQARERADRLEALSI